MMDEPFSQVDALTAEGLRREVLNLWDARKGNLSSIVMVSHDVSEVVAMADRVIILGTSPCRVRTIVDNRLPRPREPRCRQVLALVDYLHEIITFTEMPEAEKRDEGAFEPLPKALFGEIVGMLEYLDTHGGQEDVFHLAAVMNRKYNHAITVASAAEMLDFVSTARRLVVLEREGRHFVRASPADRKKQWCEKLQRLRLFREVVALLEKQPRRQITSDKVLEMLHANLPSENFEKQFEALVNWARYGDLFIYNEGAKTLALP